MRRHVRKTIIAAWCQSRQEHSVSSVEPTLDFCALIEIRESQIGIFAPLLPGKSEAQGQPSQAEPSQAKAASCTCATRFGIISKQANLFVQETFKCRGVFCRDHLFLKIASHETNVGQFPLSLCFFFSSLFFPFTFRPRPSHLIEDSSCIRMICQMRPRMRIEFPSMMSCTTRNARKPVR